MSHGTNRRERRFHRRTFAKMGGIGALGALAGCMPTMAHDGVSPQHGHGGSSGSDSDSDANANATTRISGAEPVSPRDFHEENYEITHTYRRNEAVRVLLRDPEVNAIASDWIASFEAYEPLTNALGTVSVQGCPDYTASGGFDEGGWEVTAKDRQVIYGLVDRRHNELVALQINDPIDVSWEETFDEAAMDRGRIVYDQPEVQEYLEGKDWWALEKVGESITAFKDEPHGDVTIVIFPAVDDDSIGVVSGYVNVSGEEPTFEEVFFVEKFVRYPIQQLARESRPNDESVLGEAPTVPKDQRPFKTAENGFHRFDTLPGKSFSQAGWGIEWESPETMGVTFSGTFRGQPVFAAMNSPTTFTGYYMPPREGRNTLDWFFPDHDPDFNGHHLFWDIHSVSFGGPGELAKIDYPARRGHPEGFQFRTHYHTGAQGRSSIDFHSGVRFAPYNYNISYEFFADGRIMPLWHRHGPGYVTESLYEYSVPEDYEGEEEVVQQYISAQALDVTPGTEDGVEVLYFDGDTWCKPAEEFYHVGRPGTKLRFTNPNGPQTIDVPMDRGLEAVVLKRNPEDIGPADSQLTRVVDMDAELDFYHPAQYVDGEGIQNERVILWLLLEASMDEVPHPAGVTAYAAVAELQLEGY